MMRTIHSPFIFQITFNGPEFSSQNMNADCISNNNDEFLHLGLPKATINASIVSPEHCHFGHLQGENAGHCMISTGLVGT